MNKFALIAAVLVIVALLVWLLRHESAAPGALPTPTAEAPEKPVEVAPTPLVAALPAPREVVREAAPPVAPSAPAAKAPTSESPAAGSHAYDPNARDWIHLIVQDKHGAPIANADIRLTGLRSPRDPGTHWGWFSEEPSIGRTALDGTAKLWFPVWINADVETGSVSLDVEHADYITHNVQDFKIGAEPRVIVLEQGAFVVVSGWIESPDQVLRDVVPYMTWGAKIQPDAWLPIKDGRLSCASIPPGKHGIYLAHRSAEDGMYYSAPEMFEVNVGEQKELHLQLFQGRRFEGRLDPAVPRPITLGSVRLNLQFGERSSPNATMLREYAADVNADGSFAFTDLPPGDGQIIGSCDGWVSANVPAGRDYLSRPDASAAEIEMQLAAYGNVPQPAPEDTSRSPFVLRMEPAATLQATIVDKAGQPIQGATLTLWPNVHWRTGYSNLFMQRVYEGKSDEHGRLTITNLPSGNVSGGVQHERYAIAETELGRRQVEVELEAGKTRELRVELVASQEQ
jgi:hypothetical protein